LLFLVVFGGVCHAATIYSGSISDGNGLSVSNSDWNDVVLSWTVTIDGNVTYEWTWSRTAANPKQDLSHFDVEVSGEAFGLFTMGDVISWSVVGTQGTDGFDITALSDLILESPVDGIPRGLKFDDLPDPEGAGFANSDPPMDITFTLVTTRLPMWGDVFGKSGSPTGGFTAKNTGFGTDTAAPIGDGNAIDGNGNAWVLVPDTAVPIPSAFWLLAPALVCLLGFRKRFKAN
jgi:hypothetical protein